MNITNLQRIWQNEKFSKDLLKFEETYITNLIIKIEKCEEEISKRKVEDNDIMELDIERVKYMMKDYLRIRLAKIEMYLFHIIKHDLHALLSKQEFEFACELFKIKRNYFSENFVKKVNPEFNDFKPNNLNQNIIVSPPDGYGVVKSISNEAILVNLKDAYPDSLDVKTIYKDDVYLMPLRLVRYN